MNRIDFKWMWKSGVLLLWMAALVSCSRYSAVWKGDLDASGDPTFRPIVFVHGFAGSAEQYEIPALRFAANGYPVSWINGYDYNSTGPHGGPEPLDAYIDAVRERTGFETINLVGHSRGTMVSQEYLGDTARAAKVAHYANIGGRPAGNVGGVPTLVVGSHGDKIAGPGTALGDAQHVVFEQPDHLSVASGLEAFKAVYSFFNDGREPEIFEVPPAESIAIGGFAKFFGPNEPVSGATIDIWEVDAETGRRTAEEPLISFVADGDGAWGPFRARPGQPYEFHLKREAGDVNVHYYREPFVRTDMLVYLKARDASNPAGAMISNLVKADDAASVAVVSPLVGAIVAGRDSLKVNGVELATEEIAAEDQTKVGIYLFDGDRDGETDGTHIGEGLFSGRFISAADVYIPTEEPATVTFQLNGATIHTPNWKAASEGQIYVQFN